MKQKDLMLIGIPIALLILYFYLKKQGLIKPTTKPTIQPSTTQTGLQGLLSSLVGAGVNVFGNLTSSILSPTPSSVAPVDVTQAGQNVLNTMDTYYTFDQYSWDSW